jgi:hypothetical protein
MKLIGIAGRKGSGKDTFAKPLLIDNDGEFNLVKFADGLKNMLRSLFRDAGCDAETIEEMIEGKLKETPTDVLFGKTPREAMQSLGTEWRNMINVGLWLGITDLRLKKLARGGAKGVIITDVRFQHEVEYLRKLGGTVFRIVGNVKDNEFSNHSSEKLIDELEVDGEIFNFGTIDELWDVAGAVSDSVNGSNI